MNSPEVSKSLHKAVSTQNYDHYEIYNTRRADQTALRDLLDFNPDRAVVTLDSVEHSSREALLPRVGCPWEHCRGKPMRFQRSP